ncbi:MAG: hypothetical protein M3275_10535 [Thermoproteota archaeon]|nr:hypothetical protein [Thermoproteota archaeon]
METNTVPTKEKDKQHRLHVISLQHDDEITKTWISGQNSCTLIIPRSVAREYGLDSPAHVVVRRTSEGILIQKLSQ